MSSASKNLVNKPWGFYKVLEEEYDHKVKQIGVRPGQRTSLQRHTKRSEHWIVIQGEGKVVVGEEEINIHPGSYIEVGTYIKHRIQNTGPMDIVLIEIQRGSYLGEDDIERLEDDYGRQDQ